MKYVHFIMIAAALIALSSSVGAGGKNSNSSGSTDRSFRIVHRSDGRYAVRPVHAAPASASFRPPPAKRSATLAKIADQRALLERMDAARKNTERRQVQRRTSEAMQPEKLKLRGQPTAFYKGAFFDASADASTLPHAASPNVLINGAVHDTVFVGDPITVTWSFAPSQIGALLNIYIDTDSNGIVSEKDIHWIDNVTAYDNDYDSDPADGAYKLELSEGNNIASIMPGIIIEVNDFQSVSTAVLTVRQHPSSGLVRGTIVPARPDRLLFVDRSPDRPLYCVTDSAGRFRFAVDRSITKSVSFEPDLEFGLIPGYLPPSYDPISLTSDTADIVLTYRPASEFIEGYARDQFGNGIGNVQIEADNASMYLHASTDSTGYYKLGCTAGAWSLYSLAAGSGEYLPRSQTSTLFVLPNATARSDFAFTRSNETISGRVTMNGTGLEGIPISVSTERLSNRVLTQADGRYSVPVFKPAEGNTNYGVQITLPMGYYAEIPSLTNIPPGAANIDFQIFKITGGAQGTVTDEATGAPIPEAGLYFSGQYYRSTSTDDSGAYRVSLRNGMYGLTIDAPAYGPYTEEGIVIDGGIITKNFRLRHGASYSGRVTDELGKPIEYASVYTVDSAGNVVAYSTYTDRDGRYVMGTEKAGRFFAYAEAAGLVRQWYDRAENMSTAAAIEVAEGKDTPGIDFVLSRGGSIAGVVRDASGKPLPHIIVAAFDSLYNGTTSARTNDSGAYLVPGLAEGSYHAVAYDPQQLYCDQYYNGAASPDDAAAIRVGAKQTVGNIDFTLHIGGFLSGTVKDSKNNGLSYAQIEVVDSTYVNSIGYTVSDASGRYTVSPLEPYRTCFVHARKWMNSYPAEQWFDHAAGPDSATPIVLMPGELRSAVDFSLPVGGTIAGKVFDPSGAPFPFGYVSAEDAAGLRSFGGSVDQLGGYSIENIPQGTYFVCAHPMLEFQDQWYNRKPSRLTADPVTVTDDETSANINFYLVRITPSRDSIEVKIRLAAIPDTLVFNQAHAADSCADYWWGVRFDADNDSSTGVNGCEIELALLHSKNATEPECRSTLLGGTSHLLLGWSGGEAYSLQFDVPAWIDPADKNTLVMRAPKSWPELSRITNGTKHYFHTLYASPSGVVEDVTPATAQMSVIADAAGDVPYAFVDLVSGTCTELITGVAAGSELPADYRLDQNYPNPFNPSTTIRYALPARAHVRLAVYDVLGREVAVLVNEVQTAGWRDIEWSAAGVSSGMYFYRLTAGSFVQTNRMLVVK